MVGAFFAGCGLRVVCPALKRMIEVAILNGALKRFPRMHAGAPTVKRNQFCTGTNLIDAEEALDGLRPSFSAHVR